MGTCLEDVETHGLTTPNGNAFKLSTQPTPGDMDNGLHTAIP